MYDVEDDKTYMKRTNSQQNQHNPTLDFISQTEKMEPNTASHRTPHSELTNGINKQSVVSSIPSVPVTVERKPFIQPDNDQVVQHTGTPRANIAVTKDHPEGTTENDWASKHRDQSVLQQHCDFFDRDHDGIIWPQDTYVGFHRVGFNILLSLLAVFIIHANFSYPTSPSWLPDPFFRVYLKNVHKAKHGSDSGTYDTEGRFVPQKFEDIFAKYSEGKDGITIYDVSKLLKGQRLIADPIGWGGAFFEWLATYIMLWPEDGKMRKEDIRGIYDGSLFYTIAERREKKQSEKSIGRNLLGKLATAVDKTGL